MLFRRFLADLAGPHQISNMRCPGQVISRSLMRMLVDGLHKLFILGNLMGAMKRLRAIGELIIMPWAAMLVRFAIMAAIR